MGMTKYGQLTMLESHELRSERSCGGVTVHVLWARELRIQ